MREFRLRGHDCVFGKYPAPVIPIGLADGHQVAVYPGGAEGPCLVRVEPSAGFVMYGPELLNQLAGFDPLRHRLFAYSSNRIRCYVADEEQEFFRDFLNNTDESQNTHPSIRRMLMNTIQGKNFHPGNNRLGAQESGFPDPEMMRK